MNRPGGDAVLNGISEGHDALSDCVDLIVLTLWMSHLRHSSSFTFDLATVAVSKRQQKKDKATKQKHATHFL